MLKGLKNAVEKKYSDRDLLVRKKAGILFNLDVFIFTLMLLLSLIPLLMNSGGSHGYSLLMGTGTLMLGGLASLIFLYAGLYGVASAALVVAVVIAGGLGLAGKYMMVPHTGFAIIFFYQSAVVFAALIANLAVTSFVAFLMIAYASVYYFLVRGMFDGKIAELMKAQFTESVFAIVLTYFLTVAIIRMMSDVVEKMRAESENSEKQYGKVRSLLDTILYTSERLRTSSGEMTEAAARLSSDAQEQAASLEEISSSMEELTANFENIENSGADSYESLVSHLDYLKLLSSLIQMVREETDRVSALFNDINGLIRNAGSTINATIEGTSAMLESSSRVTDIVSIIDDFFEKINLLSLNASIEAARAGDYGRGFAVVADEISKLSDRSAESLKEISSLIERNRGEVEKNNGNNAIIVDLVGNIIKRLQALEDSMAALFDRIREQNTLKDDIEKNTGELKNRSEDIRNATSEQKRAIEQINTVLTTINGITQSNAAFSEELAGTTRSIHALAEELHSRVNE